MDYNDIAVKWEAMQKYTPAPRHRRRLIINLMQVISFQSVLDIGCGKGLMLNQIGKKYGASLTGCDISEKAIKEAGKLRSEGKGYSMQDGDVVNFLFNV